MTENNKDYVYRVSVFIKEFMINKDISVLEINRRVDEFVNELGDEGIIDTDYKIELEKSLRNVLAIMIDNPENVGD